MISCFRSMRFLTEKTGRSFSSHAKLNHSIKMTPIQDEKVASNWHYCSDHLPVIGSVLGLRVGSWNKLNTAYIPHMTRLPWKEGFLVQLAKTKSSLYSELTQREEECFENIKALLTGKNSLDILCIQECSDIMFQFLRKSFSSSKIVPFMTDGGMDNHVVTLVKTSDSLRVEKIFSKILWNREYIPKETRTAQNPQGISHFGRDNWRPAQCVNLIKTSPLGKEEEFTVVNIHISCAGKDDNYKIARGNELSEGLQDLYTKNGTTICLGDFNMSRQLLAETGLNKLQNLASYHGHIDAKQPELHAIDQILVRTNLKQFCRSVPLKECSDQRAASVYENAIKPIVLDNCKSYLYTIPCAT